MVSKPELHIHVKYSVFKPYTVTTGCEICIQQLSISKKSQ